MTEFSLSILFSLLLVFLLPSLLLAHAHDKPTVNSSAAVDIKKTLIDARHFNIIRSLLTASGVLEEITESMPGAGVTLLVPTDQAFINLPNSEMVQSLPALKKIMLIKYHILNAYYSPGTLGSFVNPAQATLATEVAGAGLFTLNITRGFRRSTVVNTGLVQTYVNETVLDKNPVSIFGVSEVLLPRELFDQISCET